MVDAGFTVENSVMEHAGQCAYQTETAGHSICAGMFEQHFHRNPISSSFQLGRWKSSGYSSSQ